MAEPLGLTFFFDESVRGFECELIGVLESFNNQADVQLSPSISKFSSDVEVAFGETENNLGKTVISAKTLVVLSKKIKWTKDAGCDRARLASTERVPITQVFWHEVMHVLGFEHDDDEESIMFHNFQCQTVRPEDIRKLRDKFGNSRRVAVFTDNLNFFFSKTFQKIQMSNSRTTSKAPSSIIDNLDCHGKNLSAQII